MVPLSDRGKPPAFRAASPWIWPFTASSMVFRRAGRRSRTVSPAVSLMFHHLQYGNGGLRPAFAKRAAHGHADRRRLERQGSRAAVGDGAELGRHRGPLQPELGLLMSPG